MSDSSIQWTPEQRSAIDARRGTLLVCAAAGSGKTAVLVERVAERLADPQSPCNVEELLIVTFTRAAAAQMRERIASALAKRLAAEPANGHLRHQQLRLPFAQISTIDSFCNELVRAHFHRQDRSPDYALLDQSEEQILRGNAVNEVIAEAYREQDPVFLELTRQISSSRDDSGLAKVLVDLYTAAQASPFPAQFLEGLLLPYLEEDPLGATVWGGLILGHVEETLRALLRTHWDMLERIQGDELVDAAFRPALEADIRMLECFLAVLQARDWDAAYTAFQEADWKFQRLGSLPKEYRSPARGLAETCRKRFKDTIKKIPERWLFVDREAQRQDCAQLKPLVEMLLALTGRFASRYEAAKAEQNKADFSDVIHWALDLLITPGEDGSPQKTALAEELSQGYAEILVDEYQDINEAQELLFWALSREEQNLFMVGDVKQSIYRFRQSKPEIFIRRSELYPKLAGENYPAKVILGQNFRSRRGITGAVNFIFRQLMSKATGEIEYNEDEALVAAATYPDKPEPDAELHILQKPEADGEALGRDALQAEYVAGLIQKMMRSGMTVKDSDGERPLRCRDICVLLLKPRGRAGTYMQAMAEHGIPAYTESTGGFFQAAEIRFILSLLRVLDNPLQDIPLLGVLLSPVYGFTADDLAQIRLAYPEGGFYHTLTAAAAREDEKCQTFLAQLNTYRRLSGTCAAGDLLRRLCEQTGYLSLAGAMRGGKQRQANLRLLLAYAEQYQSYGQLGLFGFLRFMDSLEREGQELDAAALASETADVVRVLSIHKSKGLEFPVCILADSGGQFNQEAQKGNLVWSQHAGIGLRLRDETLYCMYNTVGRAAAILERDRLQRAEELRLLYVALTRAKERLVIVSAPNYFKAAFQNAAANIGAATQMEPHFARRAKSFDDWLLPAVLRHPDARNLRQIADMDDSIIIPADFHLKTVLAEQPQALSSQQDSWEEQEAVPDADIIKELKDRLAYRYPYESLRTILAKRAASELTQPAEGMPFFAASRPAFLRERKLTPAERGTATHRFMQFAELRTAALDPASERERLLALGQLSPEEGEAVDLKAVRHFFGGALAKRMLAAETLFRERAFALQVPARELYPRLDGPCGEEQVVVQGIVDCAFEEDGALVIVDYKTDRSQTEEALRKRYAAQLRIYRRALEACLELPVKETYLYTFFLRKAILLEEL